MFKENRVDVPFWSVGEDVCMFHESIPDGVVPVNKDHGGCSQSDGNEVPVPLAKLTTLSGPVLIGYQATVAHEVRVVGCSF